MESDLAALIARLEKAKEGSRELDRSVWAWVAEHVWKWPEGQTGVDADGKNNSVVLIPPDLPKGFTYPPKGAVDRYYHVPSDPVTTDLSAAVALCERALPGWHWSIRKKSTNPDFFEGLVTQAAWSYAADRFKVSHDCATLALCLAILRAKAATHE